MVSVILKYKMEEYGTQNIIIAGIQAKNGNTQLKWQEIEDIMWSISKNYKYPKIIMMDINTDIHSE